MLPIGELGAVDIDRPIRQDGARGDSKTSLVSGRMGNYADEGVWNVDLHRPRSRRHYGLVRFAYTFNRNGLS